MRGQLAAFILAVSVVAACGGDPASEPDGCAQVVDEAEQADDEGQQAFREYYHYTDGTGFGSQTPEGKRLGEAARLAMVTYLHIVINSPECFSPKTVAEAEAVLPSWEQPGTQPPPRTS